MTPPRGRLYYSPMFKGNIRLVLITTGLMVLGALGLRAQGSASCPPVLNFGDSQRNNEIRSL